MDFKKILLIQPSYQSSIWTYSEVHNLAGWVGYTPNIALATLAALATEGVDITIIDETISSIDFDQKWDLVGITGYITQKDRIIEIADQFRKRGQLVAIGGPYATLSPSTLRPHADILFLGESERTWPQFLEDFCNGRWKSEYRATEVVDINESPPPALNKLGYGEYMMGVVQTSRGCPFECEFCDVIVYLGRKQRHKTPARVIEELENFYEKGYRHVFLADDNLTVNRKKAADIMTAIADWNSSKPERTTFATQMSIDIARDQDSELLDICAEAGLKHAFIGIETPDSDALREVKKRQNLRDNLIEDVQKIQSRGIVVMAGMISGFDHDTKDSFINQYNFIQDAGIMMAQITPLHAPEGTALERRLIKENRLKPFMVDDGYFETNILPKNMTEGDLLAGVHWLWNKWYSPEAFIERARIAADNSPCSTESNFTRRAVLMMKKIIPEYKNLGKEFEQIPGAIMEIFKGRDKSGVGGALLFYLNTVLVLKKRGVWNPKLASLREPDFNLFN